MQRKRAQLPEGCHTGQQVPEQWESRGRHAAGGYGGNAGAGGQGGGGAGGTIKLVGSVVFTNGLHVDAAGGAGVNPGQTGRLLLGRHNATDAFGGDGSFQTPETGPGPTGPNPFLSSGADTPYIPDPDMIGGAEVYGLTDLSPVGWGHVLANVPADALAALVRIPLEGWTGYDGLFLMNFLSDDALDDPAFGVGEQGTQHLQGLLRQGYELNPMFGGSGPEGVPSLDPQRVYMTLISREQAGRFSVYATVGGVFYQATTDDLTGGEALFLVVPEPTSLAILVVGGLACLIRRR